ncbi:hypothetical protein D3C71_1601760 [compost metagenome]
MRWLILSGASSVMKAAASTASSSGPNCSGVALVISRTQRPHSQRASSSSLSSSDEVAHCSSTSAFGVCSPWAKAHCCSRSQ